MASITFTVPGIAAPAGSKKVRRFGFRIWLRIRGRWVTW